MARILVIDDDVGTLEGYVAILKLDGHEVATAQSAADGVERAQADGYDLMLCDLRLGERSGLDVLRSLNAAAVQVPVVMVTGFATTRTAVEAMQLGAIDYVEKPLVGDQLVAVVGTALSKSVRLRQAAVVDGVPHTDAASSLVDGAPVAEGARRLVDLVLRAIRHPTDPCSLREWAACSAVSVGTLKNWCYTANLRPRRLLVFARFLRAVVLYDRYRHAPQDSLNFADRRTFSGLLQFGGLECEDALTRGVEHYLRAQALIRSPAVLDEVRRQLQGADAVSARR